MNTEQDSDLSLRLLLVLALLSATAPLAIDVYLPSFPEVKESLDTGATQVQFTLSAFFLGLSVGQFLWGPISDRLGRRTPLLIGTSISTVAAFVAASAPTIEVLIGARFVQAVAGAAAVTVTQAVIADLFHGFRAARVMSLMGSIVATTPVVAPVIGGALATTVSWRIVLGVVFVMTLLQIIAVYTTIPETLPEESRTAKIDYGNIGRVLRKPAFLGYIGTQWAGFGAILGYIASSSFIYQEVIGTSEFVFGVLFGVNALGLVIAGIASSRLAKHRIHPARTVSFALPAIVLSSVLVLIIAVSPVTPWLLSLPLFTVCCAAGFTMGNSGALSIEQARPHIGAGAAVMGGGMNLLGAAIAPIGGLADRGTAVPLGIEMTVSSLIAVACFTFARRYVAAHPDSDSAFMADAH